MLETRKLILRPHTLDDVEAAYQMNLDARVSRFTGDGGVVDRQEIERRIQEDVIGDYNRHGFGRWAVETKADNRYIGFAGLKFLPEVEEVDLGYRLHPNFWGKGLATEAGSACLRYGFEHLHLKRIIAWVLPGNPASIRVLEKLGFCFEKKYNDQGLSMLQYVCNRHKHH